jgi:hypothetical protein
MRAAALEAGRHARFNGLARSSPKQHIGRPFLLCGLTTNPSERKRARKPCPQVVALSSANNFEMSQYLYLTCSQPTFSWEGLPLFWDSPTFRPEIA